MSKQNRFCFTDLSGGYGSMTIVSGLNGGVDPGQCLCVLGRNGVGKSTLLKLLSGHLRTTDGEVVLEGDQLNNLSPDERRGKNVSYAPQERPVFENLTVRENLLLMQPSDTLDLYEPYFLAFPVLAQRLTQMAGTLSGGERKILSFTRVMAENSAVTLLDEPTEGVQPENIQHMQRFILDAKSNNRAFIVVEQHIHLAEAIADQYLIMDHGQCVLTGSSQLVSREEILRRIEV